MTCFVTFSDGGPSRAGALRDDRVLDLSAAGIDGPDLLSLIEGGADALSRANDAVDQWDGPDFAKDDVTLHAPISRPAKIIGIGLNYIDHCHESGLPVPEKPVVFTKHSNTVTGPFDEVSWRTEISTEVDYEVELGVIIGQKTSRVSEADALNYVFGYSVVNDVSARDLQLGGGAGQWDLGKSLDTFCPWGPGIVTADEIPDPQALDCKLTLNGDVRQNSNTSNMIFSVAELVSYLSQYMTLEPGDLIATGTPPGVGMGMDPKGYMADGDVCEVEIEKLGVIRNRMRILD